MDSRGKWTKKKVRIKGQKKEIDQILMAAIVRLLAECYGQTNGPRDRFTCPFMGSLRDKKKVDFGCKRTVRMMEVNEGWRTWERKGKRIN